MSAPPATRNPAVTRQKLVGATLQLMLRQGFAATTVDQICAEAGLTKGSFFHYFATKEAIGRAAVDAFAQMGMDLYAAASNPPGGDPLDQLHRLFDIMTGFTTESDDPCVCMVGMLSQELAGTNPAMRAACARHLTVWTEMVERMLKDAKKEHRPKVAFDPGRIAWMLNSLWQGSMLIAKTRQTPEMIVSNLRLARAYVDGLFDAPVSRRRRPAKRTRATRRHLRRGKPAKL